MVLDVPKLSVKEKLSYGLGDFGANLVFQSQISFLLFFYTDVFGISAATAGTILLFSRILDAISDPVIGAVSDRTESRWGKYRPWLLWTALPLSVAFVLCYTTPGLTETGKVVWAVATCSVLMFLYAANNIPYSALSGVMTGDSTERTSLLSWRFVCVMAAVFVVNMFTLELVEWLGGGDKAVGYRGAMAVWAALAAICFGIAFAFTRERISTKQSDRGSLRQDLSELLYSGPWLALFAIGVLINIQLALRGGAMLHYFTHFLAREDLYGWFSGLGIVMAMIGILLSNPLAARFGKRVVFQTCLLLSAASIACFALLPRDWPWALFALQVLFQLAFGPTIPLLWTMMADVADYSEWKTGRQSTALAFASIVFGMKLGLGIGSWLSGEWLELVGYSKLSSQPEPAVRGIVMLVSIFPAAALMMGFVVLFFYPINDRREQQMRTALRERRESQRLH
jgi:GPH family glycoside/pentoside/hexuronide:cation symporter